MTRVFTIFDLLWFLLSLCGKLVTTMARSRHNVLGSLAGMSLVMVALSVFLSYRCVNISRLRNPYIVDDLSEPSVHVYNQMAHTNHLSVLLRNMPPLTVHYMWCRKSHFEFKHYLSLLSVAKVLKPDQIVFHYLELPQTDQRGYFTWFEDIQRELAMISLKPIKNAQHCSHDFSKGIDKSEDFPTNSGVFMMEDVAVTNLSREVFYKLTGADGILKQDCGNAKNGCGALLKNTAQLFLMPASEPYHLVGGPGRAVIECPTIEDFNKANQSFCLQLSQRLFPSDIWRQNKTFDRFARWVAYSHPESIKPLPQVDQSAPRIAHVLKFDGEETLSPVCFASLLSAFTQGELTHIFLHGHKAGKGKDALWNKLVSKFSLTRIPTPVLDTPRKQLLYGLQVLLQYGGVLLSCDTIVQKPLHSLLLYPSASTVQKTKYRIIHHHVDFSVMVARHSSQYLRNLIPVIKQLTEINSDRDLGAVAYHLYEQNPTSVHMDTNLVGHLTCNHGKCLPSAGQGNLRQAYAVKFTWAEGSPPSTFNEFLHLSTPLQSLNSLSSFHSR